MLEINKIYNMDCIEGLKLLDDNSVDAIITDPPYGLEFMGKEWDKFAPSDTNKERWEGKRKEMLIKNEFIPETTNMSGKFFQNKKVATPNSFGKKQNQKCLNCGHYKFSGTPCKCEEPDWEIRENKFNLGYQEFTESWATECLRVLKHGGYLLSFGGTRTYHRMTCGIEDAGFEIRDCIMWLYGSGFPKSLNIGKQIDKINGVEQEQIEYEHPQRKNRSSNYSIGFSESDERKNETGSKIMKGIATSPEAKEWEGWGTALKPAVEPIVVARKPLSEKNVALNVLKWGTGGINIDESRIEFDKDDNIIAKNPHTLTKGTDAYDVNCYGKYNAKTEPIDYTKSLGRFPANIILDEESAKMLDEQSGESKTNPDYRNNKIGNQIYEGGWTRQPNLLNDKGGASRFFYVAKASKSERNEGLDEFSESTINDGREKSIDNPFQRGETPKRNLHPTVKPIKLMEYLIKLVTRENSIVLDPFLGSGTTAIACRKLNRNFIGFEKEQDYVNIANARLNKYLEQQNLLEVK